MKPLDLARARDLPRILDDAFGLYRAHFGTFLAILLAVVLPIDLVVLGGVLGQLTGGYDPSPPPGSVIAETIVTYFVITPLVTAMHVHAVMDVAAGRPPTARAAIARGADVFAPLVVVLVLTMAAIFAGVLALFVGAIVVSVHLAVVAQVVVVEGERGTAALARSWRLVRGNAWWVFGVTLVTGIIVGVIGLVASIPLEVAADAADLQALSLLGTIVGHLLTLSLAALIATLLYFTLVAKAGEPAPRLGGSANGEAARAFGGVPERWEPPAPGSYWGPPTGPPAGSPADPPAGAPAAPPAGPPTAPTDPPGPDPATPS